MLQFLIFLMVDISSFYSIFLSQVPVAAHDPGYANLIVTSPANGTYNVSGDRAQHAEAPGHGQKDADLRDQQKQ
jgi:hypothetical protein